MVKVLRKFNVYLLRQNYLLKSSWRFYFQWGPIFQFYLLHLCFLCSFLEIFASTKVANIFLYVLFEQIFVTFNLGVWLIAIWFFSLWCETRVKFLLFSVWIVSFFSFICWWYIFLFLWNCFSALINIHLASPTCKEPGSHHPYQYNKKKDEQTEYKQFLDPLENWDLSANWSIEKL